MVFLNGALMTERGELKKVLRGIIIQVKGNEFSARR
jgi:hypothetical protein